MYLPHGYHATWGYPKQPPHIPFGWGGEGGRGKGDGRRNDPAATMATANATNDHQRRRCHGRHVVAVAVVVIITLSPLSCCRHGRVVVVLLLLSRCRCRLCPAHRLHPARQQRLIVRIRLLDVGSTTSAARHPRPLLDSSCSSSASVCSVSALVVIHPGGSSVTPLGILILPNSELLLHSGERWPAIWLTGAACGVVGQGETRGGEGNHSLVGAVLQV
jgi:hypothetical protein